MVTGQKVRWVLDMMRGTEFAGRQIAAYEVRADGDAHDILLREAGVGEDRCDLAELKQEMLALGEQGATMQLRLSVAPVRHVVFDTGRIDGFGWACFTARDGDNLVAPVTELANEHLRVTVDRATGTYTIETNGDIRAAGLGRLVDGGDGGDTYNYSPPDRDVVIDRPDRVEVTVTESGPVRTRVFIDATYTWPAAAVGDDRMCTARSDDTVAARIITRLELRAGERFLRVRHEIENMARDHRLRAHFPLPATVSGSDAECAFTVVHRGLTAEGGTHEYALPTFPSRRFVDASDGTVGLALIHDGLLEYEVVDEGRELALTLLRATGYLSRSEPQLRPNPAGPTDPVRGAQLAGEQIAEYAVLPHHGDWRAADCYGAADAFLTPMEKARIARGSARTRPSAGATLRVDGAEVSAVTREPGGLVVRVVRTADTEGPVAIEYEGVPGRGHLVDLRGAPIEPFEGSITLRPWQIATLQLRA
jgi:hypothetical protein